jgi:hypothetical protein
VIQHSVLAVLWVRDRTMKLPPTKMPTATAAATMTTTTTYLPTILSPWLCRVLVKESDQCGPIAFFEKCNNAPHGRCQGR